MKVQAGVARMLINTSSKIAQIARSRPIPFDIPCKRYGREPFFDPRRNTRSVMPSICELHARTRVTYTNARSECIIGQKKENDGKKRVRTSRAMKKESDEETKPGRKPVQFLKPVQSVSYAKSITFYPATSSSPETLEGSTIFKSTRSRAVIQLLRRNFSPT